MKNIVDAAIAVWKGDTDPAERWLRALGREVTKEGKTILWRGNGPSGALSPGQDPTAAIAQLLMATMGGLWAVTDEGQAIMEQTMKRWQAGA